MDLSDTIPSLVDVLDSAPAGEEAACAADEAARASAETAAASAAQRAACERASAAAATRAAPGWHPLSEGGARGTTYVAAPAQAAPAPAKHAPLRSSPKAPRAARHALRPEDCFSLMDEEEEEEAERCGPGFPSSLFAVRSSPAARRPRDQAVDTQLTMEPLTLDSSCLVVGDGGGRSASCVARGSGEAVAVVVPPSFDDPLRAAAAAAEGARAPAAAPPEAEACSGVGFGTSELGGVFPEHSHVRAAATHQQHHPRAVPPPRPPPPRRRARRADVALRELLKVCAGRGEERYDSRARVALRRVARHLRLTKSDVTALEAELGAALPHILLWPSLSRASDAAPEGEGADDHQTLQQEGTAWLVAPLDAARCDPDGTGTAFDSAASYRSYKVAAAAAAGAGLLAVTGGLAAPAILAGAASILPGAVAVSGAGGFMAGAAITGGFSVAGGSVAARGMARRTAPLKEFTFAPVLADAEGGDAVSHARMAVTLCVSGWLQDKEDFVRPWAPLSALDAERIAVVWESKELLNLGAALKAAATDVGVAELVKHGAMHTILQGLLAAVALPATFLTAASLIDNSWARCLDRADQAGALLACALMEGAWYQRRPVTLLGYSLGARVVFGAMQRLAQAGCSGIVETVVLFGAPVSETTAEWDAVRQVVSCRLVNVYSENDWVLGLAFRATALSSVVAGLRAVHAEGVENVDVSSLVKGHTQYPLMLPQLLRVISQQQQQHRNGLRGVAVL